MSDNITLPREVAEKALSMLDLLGLLGENVAGRIRAALAEPTVKDSLTAQEALRRENERLRAAYQRMKNVAAGYSNLVDYRPSTRKLEREFDRKLEREFDAIEAALRREDTK